MAEASPRVWAEEPGGFSTFRIGKLRHDFHRHPLLQLGQLELLAQELFPLHQCRFVRPGITQASGFAHADRHPRGLDIEEVFQRIEEPGSWVALYNVESIPRYRALLGEILDTVRSLVEREQPGIFMETGFIFISAPPSVTPFHIDRENNFWLQLRGRKTMNVWPPTDRTVVSAVAVEEFIVGHSLKNVRLREEFLPRSREFDVGPGDGVYFPSTSPHMTRSERHWVAPGDGVSISFGVNFYTRSTRHMARVHQFNRVLRKVFGMTPAYPGQSPAADAFKAPLGRVVGATRQLAASTVRWSRRARPGGAAGAPPGSY
ncbi:MAG: hypothetical protein NVSMB34_13540 [Variovorax sp.]